MEIEAWYRGNAATTWRDEVPTLEETRIHAKCLRTVAAVRAYFADYRKSKKNENGAAVNKRRHTMSHEFDGIGGLDFQLGSMLQMGLAGSTLSSGLPSFDLDHLLMANGVLPPLNLPTLEPNVMLSQIQHSAAVAQQNTLNAISQQLSALRKVKASDSALEDQDTRPDDEARSLRLEALKALSRDELEARVLALEDQMERKEHEVGELEEALAKATNTSTGELREAVSALQQMSAQFR